MEPTIPPTASRSKSSFSLVLIIIFLALYSLIISALFFAHFFGLLTFSNTKTDESFFTNQSATINGKITKVNGSTLTILSNNNQKTADLKVSDTFSITDLSNPTATPSTDLANLKLDTDANIIANMKNGAYQITSIILQLPLTNGQEQNYTAPPPIQNLPIITPPPVPVTDTPTITKPNNEEE